MSPESGEYGPRSAGVEEVLLMVDRLDADRIFRVAEAYRHHGKPHPRFVWAAAYGARRSEEVGLASHRAITHAQVYGISYPGDPNDVRLASWAASNAALGAATEDLVGTMAYSLAEFAWLTEPWIEGFRSF